MAKIDNSSVRLCIFGDDLDPQEITKLLSCEPTRSEKKGDIVSSQNARIVVHAKKGLWVLEPDVSKETDIEGKILNILSKLPNDMIAWQALGQKISLYMSCGIFMDAPNEGFVLPANLLHALAERGIEIGFDLYAPT